MAMMAITTSSSISVKARRSAESNFIAQGNLTITGSLTSAAFSGLEYDPLSHFVGLSDLFFDRGPVVVAQDRIVDANFGDVPAVKLLRPGSGTDQIRSRRIPSVRKAIVYLIKPESRHAA